MRRGLKEKEDENGQKKDVVVVSVKTDTNSEHYEVIRGYSQHPLNNMMTSRNIIIVITTG